MEKFIKANAICLECGTAKENPENGFCLNGHDDWVESNDDISRLNEVVLKFNVSLTVLMIHLANSLCLTKT